MTATPPTAGRECKSIPMVRLKVDQKTLINEKEIRELACKWFPSRDRHVLKINVPTYFQTDLKRGLVIIVVPKYQRTAFAKVTRARARLTWVASAHVRRDTRGAGVGVHSRGGVVCHVLAKSIFSTEVSNHRRCGYDSRPHGLLRTRCHPLIDTGRGSSTLHFERGQ